MRFGKAVWSAAVVIATLWGVTHPMFAGAMPPEGGCRYSRTVGPCGSFTITISCEEYESYKARGTSCTTPAGAPGTCSGSDLSCHTDCSVGSQTLDLGYVVVGLDYALLGEGSSLTYQAGSAFGARFHAYVTDSTGASKEIDIGRLTFSGSWQTKQVTAKSEAVFSTITSTWSRESSVDYDPAHNTDRIYLWVNPRIRKSVDGLCNVQYTWEASDKFPACGIAGQNPRVEAFEAGMLKPGGPIPPTTNCQSAFLAATSDADRLEILSYDPFWVANPDPATKYRFVLAGGRSFGSDCVGCFNDSWSFTVSKTTCRGGTAGTVTDATWEVMRSRNIGPLGSDTGKTYKLETGFLATSTACPNVSGDVLAATATPACKINALFHLDRVSGAVLMTPAGYCSVTTAMPCALTVQCPTGESCVVPQPPPACGRWQ